VMDTELTSSTCDPTILVLRLEPDSHSPVPVELVNVIDGVLIAPLGTWMLLVVRRGGTTTYALLLRSSCCTPATVVLRLDVVLLT
jgi:hypothetical protein